jgi:predicted transcriptional regulator
MVTPSIPKGAFMAAIQTTTLKLDPELKDRVKRVAESQRRTAHWVMKEAIEGYVSRAEERQAFIKEGLESLREYEETGLHVTFEEVSTWLKSWGTENELDPPECHT